LVDQTPSEQPCKASSKTTDAPPGAHSTSETSKDSVGDKTSQVSAQGKNRDIVSSSGATVWEPGETGKEGGSKICDRSDKNSKPGLEDQTPEQPSKASSNATGGPHGASDSNVAKVDVTTGDSSQSQKTTGQDDNEGNTALKISTQSTDDNVDDDSQEGSDDQGSADADAYEKEKVLYVTDFYP